jgi:hypothetical protein
MVLVGVDSGTDAVEVEFGVELRGIHVIADAEALDGAGRRGCEVNDVRRKRTRRLLVPAVRIEDVGQIGEDGIIATRDGECDRDGSDGLGECAVDGGADN